MSTIKFLVQTSGRPLVDVSGCQLYGGHSLSTGGASFLACMGVNPFKIQTLGRWTSPLVVHYAGDALASGLAEDLRPAKSGLKSAHSAIVDLVDSLEQRIRQLEALPAPAPPGGHVAR